MFSLQLDKINNKINISVSSKILEIVKVELSGKAATVRTILDYLAAKFLRHEANM